MKKAVAFVICSIVMGIVLVMALFIGIVAVPKDVFQDNYVNTLDAKYETLTKTDSPKIIIVAGSSAAFGFDGNKLADMTGMNVVNTAIHAGMGPLFEAEISKANINEGDIVLLAYEWGWETDEDYMNYFGSDMVMIGIDEKIEMYKYVPLRKYSDILGYLFTFASKKREYAGGDSGVYSRAAFSDNGNTMDIPRDDSPIIADYENDPYAWGMIDIENPTIPDNTVKYFKDYKKYVESKGASVYWIACPVYDVSVQCDYSELQKAAAQVKNQIGIPYISNPVDYILPGEYMYNSIFHPNTRGMEYTTEILFEDLKRANIVQN